MVSGAVKYRQIFWAEENGGIGDGLYEWSWGNGAVGTTIGLPVLDDCEIVGMVINLEAAGTGATVEVQVDGVAAGTIASGGANNATTTFGVPVAVSAGSKIGFRTVTGGGATDVRVGVVLEYEFDTTAFAGPSGPAGTAGAAGADGADGADGVAAISVEDEGTELTAAVTRMDFAGAGVVVTESSPDEVLVTIAGAPRRHVFEAAMTMNINDADWYGPPPLAGGVNNSEWSTALGISPDEFAQGFWCPFDGNVIECELMLLRASSSPTSFMRLMRHRKTYGTTTVANQLLGEQDTMGSGTANQYRLYSYTLSGTVDVLANDLIIPIFQTDLVALGVHHAQLRIVLEET